MSCVSPTGYKDGQTTRMNAVTLVAISNAAAYVALAVVNANDMIANYKKQNDLAKRAMEIAEAVQGSQGVFWGAENQFRNEFSTPEALEDVETMGRRYAGRLVSTILGAFAKKIREAKCGMNRYCTSANMKTLQDIYLMRAFAVGQARTLGRNIGFAEWQARNDVNWERRQQAAALGRKLTGDASSLIDAAGKGLAGIGDSYAKGFSSALQGLGNTVNRDVDSYYNEKSVMQNASTYTTNGDPYGGGYQYDTGAELFGSNSYQSNGGSPMYGPSSLPLMSEPNPGSTYGAGTEVTSGVPSSIWGDPAGGNNQVIADENVYNEADNPTDVGPVDRVRVGNYAFPVKGGGGGFVVVDMDKFSVGYADHLLANGTAKVVTPDEPNATWPQ